jgi:hypothetical protein
MILFGMESEYPDLLFHNEVRWLWRRDVLKHFASLFPEISGFIYEKGVPELTEDQWVQRFYVMVDVTFHLDQLNRKPQGKKNFIFFSKLEEAITFKKISIFPLNDLEKKDVSSFNTLNSIPDSYN